MCSFKNFRYVSRIALGSIAMVFALSGCYSWNVSLSSEAKPTTWLHNKTFEYKIYTGIDSTSDYNQGNVAQLQGVQSLLASLLVEQLRFAGLHRDTTAPDLIIDTYFRVYPEKYLNTRVSTR